MREDTSNQLNMLAGDKVYRWSRTTEKLSQKETEKMNNQLSLEIEEVKLMIKEEEKKKELLLKEEERSPAEEASSEEDEIEKKFRPERHAEHVSDDDDDFVEEGASMSSRSRSNPIFLGKQELNKEV